MRLVAAICTAVVNPSLPVLLALFYSLQICHDSYAVNMRTKNKTDREFSRASFVEFFPNLVQL